MLAEVVGVLFLSLLLLLSRSLLACVSRSRLGRRIPQRRPSCVVLAGPAAEAHPDPIGMHRGPRTPPDGSSVPHRSHSSRASGSRFLLRVFQGAKGVLLICLFHNITRGMGIPRAPLPSPRCTPSSEPQPLLCGTPESGHASSTSRALPGSWGSLGGGQRGEGADGQRRVRHKT